MEVKLDKTNLELKYKSLSDYDLAMLFKSDGLTEDAKSVLNKELSKRQLTPDKLNRIEESVTLEKDNRIKIEYKGKDTIIWSVIGIIILIIFNILRSGK